MKYRAVYDHAEKQSASIKKYSAKLAELYKNCYVSTAESALKETPDGDIFVLTGDIPAMWLRDSSAQVNHYIRLAKDPEIAEMIKKVIRRQFKYIVTDPYANAFNETANGRGHTTDRPVQIPWVWERKYEIDSLCYPVKLLYKYYKATGDRSVIDGGFPVVMKLIAEIWKTEQNHFEKSAYRFIRNTSNENDTISNNGMGSKVAYTGMTWSGFRPSDDGCVYGYLVPSNMFASAVLGYAAEMLGECELTGELLKLKSEIESGIEKYAVTEHEKFGRVYVYETDGLGNYLLRDDANIPSLLSIPYLEYEKTDYEIYKNTRNLILSKENPYYFEGKYAKGIGSPHTPKGYIWHMALIMQGLTADDPSEKRRILKYLETTDAGTGYMHEGFDADNPEVFTRKWFTWPNSLLCEFVDKCIDEDII